MELQPHLTNGKCQKFILVIVFQRKCQIGSIKDGEKAADCAGEYARKTRDSHSEMSLSRWILMQSLYLLWKMLSLLLTASSFYGARLSLTTYN